MHQFIWKMCGIYEGFMGIYCCCYNHKYISIRCLPTVIIIEMTSVNQAIRLPGYQKISNENPERTWKRKIACCFFHVKIPTGGILVKKKFPKKIYRGEIVHFKMSAPNPFAIRLYGYLRPLAQFCSLDFVQINKNLKYSIILKVRANKRT